jgi:membrane-associated phospholipid phosphatase
LKKWNIQTNNRIAVKNPNNKIPLEDYLVLSPSALTFGLQLAGVKSVHDWKESMLFYTVTNAVVASVVFPIKYITKEDRPDRTSQHSFPSGHTSIAFASAEFARIEYRDAGFLVQVWGTIRQGLGMQGGLYPTRKVISFCWIKDIS